MAVELMSFNEFTFPYNPARIEVSYDKALRLVTMPFSEPVTQEVGRAPRVVRGQGEWPEAGAFGGLARRLEQEFERGGAGRLICPVTEPMNAYFTALKLVGQGGTGTLAYAFEFTEAAGQPPQASRADGSGKGEAENSVAVKIWGTASRAAGLPPQASRADGSGKGEAENSVAVKTWGTASRAAGQPPQMGWKNEGVRV